MIVGEPSWGQFRVPVIPLPPAPIIPFPLHVPIHPGEPIHPGGAQADGWVAVHVILYGLSADRMSLKRGETVLATIERITKPMAEKLGEIRRFEGHTASVHTVAYSADGRLVVSGSGWPTSDGTIRLWDVETGKQLREFSGHEGAVYTVAFAPDGRSVLSDGTDKTLRLWDVQTGKELHSFRGHADTVWGVASPFPPTAATQFLQARIRQCACGVYPSCPPSRSARAVAGQAQA